MAEGDDDDDDDDGAEFGLLGEVAAVDVSES